ncbi:non-hydrolyzing UDP-N-acetylglucosamine 2-epimerase [Prolixibacter denitrificans]|uniref:UDP-N-acetylglucosamine 2-epimerase (non-hydrolyzing) n=1 Tax=Prolixibacter denitrificans TaxID=1541063 RepID=A0A2P8C8N3_9BACT|nr:UDP-N-acetylglucosamine 2-epimerase (non-hydrolyzing) [Prolixibacter denitrificans]PSK81330.1 UDP-N-acetylglucosamine 2-epimerase (non-hydrolysing) [Prolixibacter denitrificans]GET21585.1 UDP-N-acetyl glucosamine 2-epimerase [Prolixibacter denitrificans]
MQDTHKKRILLVFGTRPEAIKMAPLVKEFEKHPDSFETLVCVTGQHREMLDQVLQLFEITPDFDLNIMKAGQDLYDVTSRVLLGMRDVLKEAQPDVVLVHGDTSTSTAAALAAFYQQIPVGHVEAGLRTGNIYSPWPEEMNRQITGRIATYHFAPTPLSKQNLLNEGVKEENIFVTGNTVIDALYWVIDKMKQDKSLEQTITEKLVEFGLPAEKLTEWKNGAQNKWNTETVDQTDNEKSVPPPTDHSPLLTDRKLVLITGHRRENFGQGFINICEAIKELAENYPDVDFVYPMHLNPNVRNAITQVFGEALIAGSDDTSERQSADASTVPPFHHSTNTHFIEPLDYLPFVYLMNASYLVLTDSGGIQEEAPGLGKPVLVMRDTTERPEALDAGTVKLVGTDKSAIINEVTELIREQQAYEGMAMANNPYGDGKACGRIVKHFV